MLDAAKQMDAMRFCMNTTDPPLEEEQENEDTESDEDDDEEEEEEEVPVYQDEVEEKY